MAAHPSNFKLALFQRHSTKKLRPCYSDSLVHRTNCRKWIDRSAFAAENPIFVFALSWKWKILLGTAIRQRYEWNNECLRQ
jgi:hypothetical protein